jgi:autotransporter-associated beta strand protein
MFSGISLFGIGNARKSRNGKNRKRIDQQRRERRRHLLMEQLEDRRLLTVDFALSATASIAEGGTPTTFTVALSGDTIETGQTASVDIAATGTAISGTDYDNFVTAVSNAAALATGVTFSNPTLTFDDTFVAGNFTFTMNALADTLVEGTQTIIGTLSNPQATGGASAAITGASATTNITDADSANAVFQSATGGAAESAGATNITLVLTTTDDGGGTATLEAAQSINVTAANGTAADADYEGSGLFPKAVTFSIGASTGATASTTIDPAADTLVEGSQTVNLGLSATGLIAVGTGTTAQTFTITDDDSASAVFQNATGGAAESAGATNITLVLTTIDNGGGTATLEAAQSINVTAANGTAADADYEGSGLFPKAVTFSIGASTGATASTTIDPAADTLVEGSQTVNLGLSATGLIAVGTGTTAQTFTITDDDSASLSIAATTTVTEGGGVQTINVTLTTSSATLEAGVSISADVVEAVGSTALSDTDFSALLTQTVTFIAGDGNGTFQTVSITPLDDLRVEGTEVVKLTLQNLVDSPSSVASSLVTTSGDVNITDNDTATLSFASDSSNVDEDNTTHSVDVTLTLVTSGTVGVEGLDRTVAIQVNQTGGTATKSPTTPTDYAYTSTTLTFAASPPANGTSFTDSVSATIFEDILDDDAETIILSLQSLSDGTGGQVSQPAPQTHTITTNDDDTATERRFDAPTPGGYTIVRNGGNIEIHSGTAGGPLLASAALGSFDLVFNGTSGDDTLTVDFSGGNPIPSGGLTFNGGDPTSGPPGDALVLLKGASSGLFNTITHTFTSESDGSVSLDTDGPGGTAAFTITYTGLEPVSDNMDAVNRVFTFNAGGETITLQDIVDAGGNQMQIDSNVGGETVLFANPSGSLTINAGTGADIIDITSVDAAFRAALTINGDGGADTINLNAPLTLGSATSTGNVSFTAETINVNQGIDTTAGPAAGSVTMTGTTTIAAAATITATDANVSVTGATTITMVDGAAITSGTGTVTFNATGDILLSSITSTSSEANAVSLTSTGGAIVDNTALEGALVTAVNGRLSLTAATGIGGAGVADINTNVERLNATNSTLNDLVVTDVDDLRVQRAINDAVAGQVLLTSGDTLTIAAAGVGSVDGAIALTANNRVRIATVTQAPVAPDSVKSTGGNITVTANADADGTDSFEDIHMEDGAVIRSATGEIVLTTDANGGNIRIGRVVTGNGTATAVLISTAAAVVDGGDTGGADIEAIGGQATIAAGTGIGGTAGGGADNAIETTIGTLDATVTGSGAIDINETDAIVLLAVDTTDGPITIDAGGEITATNVSSTNDDDANDIILRNTSGDILVGLVTAGPANSDVYLNAAGAIVEDSTADGDADILGQDLELVAGEGIGDDAQLEIDAVNLAATTSTGDIDLLDTAGGLTIDDVNVDGIGAATSGVSITGGPGVAYHVSVVALSPLTVNSPVSDNTGGNITLAANGNSVTDDLDINANITATGVNAGVYGNINLYAGDSIDVDAAVTISASGTGAVLLSASTNYNNGGGLSNGYNGSDATLYGRVVMNDGSVVQSQDGNITIRGDGDILLSIVNANAAGGTATIGNVTIAADFVGVGGGMSDDAGAISDNRTGETANMTATLATLTAATGIGSGDDIETNVIALIAQNTTSGDVRINEVSAGGNVILRDVAQGGGTAINPSHIVVTTERGTIGVTSTSGIGVRLTSAGNTNGTVLLDANVTVPATDELTRGDVVVNQVVISQGGSITINADHDVTGSATGDITSNGGAIFITADANGGGPGGNNDGTIQLSGDIAAGSGTLTFSLRDCDGWLGATAPTGDGEILSAGDVIKNGLGALRLNGAANTYTGTTNVNAGTLLVNGSLTADTGTVHVNNGGTLGGNGTIGTTPMARDVTVYAGGTLDPGDVSTTGCSPLAGQLTVNGDVDIRPAAGLVPAGKFRVQLGGLTPGVGGYDQLVLNGTGNLYGTITDGAGGGALEVLIVSGYSVPVGGEYIIISNDLAELIGTRFLGLPEGAFLSPDGVLMNISYLAGVNDNDVVLTAPGRYDFNGFNGYTADNYMPISPFQGKTGNTAGWQTLPPQWFERHYPIAPPYTAPAPVAPDTVSERRLRYDGHATDTLGNQLTFEVDVVPGKTYEVMILTGDAAWNHDRQLFLVDDVPPPNPISTTPPLPAGSQVVDTWGGGAPEGGANIINGGGTPNASDTTGYYRWIRFTTSSATGKLYMTMKDLGGADPATVILAMDIRPVETVGQLTITGGPVFAAVEADGDTIDVYSGTGAPPGALLTVTVSAPGATATQYATITTDVDTTRFGGQVVADPTTGDFTFSVLRPATLAGTASPEDWTILVEEISGLSRGTAIQPYTTPAAKPLRFDFGDYNSLVDTANDFLRVEPRTTYNGTRGYGWTTRVASKTRIDTVNPAASTALRRDFNYARNGVFRVDLVANQTYNIRTYHANPRNGTTPFAQGAFQVYTNDSPAAKFSVGGIPAGTTEIGVFSATADANGVLLLDFRSTGSFLISGVEISVGVLDVGNEIPLLAAGDPLDSGAVAISLDMLQPVVVEAAARWSDIGLTPAQAATLSNVQFTMADLGGAYLGLANPATNTIRIDDDAARLGWSLGSGQWSAVGGQSAAGGVDLLTVVMHEMGHLLGYDHSHDDHDLMAPVLSAGRSVDYEGLSTKYEDQFDSSFIPGPSSLARPSSFVLGSPRQDDVFADLGQNDRTASDSSDAAVSALLESAQDGLLAARIAKSGEEATQARVPRRSRMERFERELDEWFAELAAEGTAGG